MEIGETKLKKLIANEGKVIVPKEIQVDEEGNEIPRVGSKIIYLAINDNEENYEEIEKTNIAKQRRIYEIKRLFR